MDSFGFFILVLIVVFALMTIALLTWLGHNDIKPSQVRAWLRSPVGQRIGRWAFLLVLLLFVLVILTAGSAGR